jgi:hypothetical protein
VSCENSSTAFPDEKYLSSSQETKIHAMVMDASIIYKAFLINSGMFYKLKTVLNTDYFIMLKIVAKVNQMLEKVPNQRLFIGVLMVGQQ